jgi:hypothetical protein
MERKCKCLEEMSVRIMSLPFYYEPRRKYLHRGQASIFKVGNERNSPVPWDCSSLASLRKQYHSALVAGRQLRSGPGSSPWQSLRTIRHTAPHDTTRYCSVTSVHSIAFQVEVNQQLLLHNNLLECLQWKQGYFTSFYLSVCVCAQGRACLHCVLKRK